MKKSNEKNENVNVFATPSKIHFCTGLGRHRHNEFIIVLLRHLIQRNLIIADNLCKVYGGWCKMDSCLHIISHTCSMGFASGKLGSHVKTLTPATWRISVERRASGMRYIVQLYSNLPALVSSMVPANAMIDILFWTHSI